VGDEEILIPYLNSALKVTIETQ